jgi:hypothetical protein
MAQSNQMTPERSFPIRNEQLAQKYRDVGQERL